MTTPLVITAAPDVTRDDKTWVVLCMLFTPLFPIIILLMNDKNSRPFIKYHNVPALILGIVEVIVATILSFNPIVSGIGGLLWIINIVYAVKANSGNNTDIPVITEFSKKQGWS